MKIKMKALYSLRIEEIIFVFSMMRKYGGMSDPTINTSLRQRSKTKHTCEKYPNLYDLSCEKWEDCDDEMFLQYNLIMQKICEK